MSKNLSAVAQQQFDDDVKHAFQGTGMLRNTVTIRNNVKADIYKFRAMGKGLANQKPTQADVTPMDISHSLINCNLENWNAPEYTDIFDQAEVNFDEQAELAQVIAMALGRRLDQLIIDALAAATPAATIVHGGVGMTLAKVTDASKELNDKGVPQGDRHFAISAEALKDMLDQTGITSADYTSIRALMSGEINSFMGFEWHMIETRTEGGLDLTSTTRQNYAYHKSAVGLAIGIDIRSEVNYVPQKTSWLCNGVMKAGSVARDGDGIVVVEITE
jgi:hypothetical protein